MQIKCASIKCDNTFFIDETKNWKFPSKRYYCISCRKQEWKIKLKCAGCFMEFTPGKLTQKYCGGDCKVMLSARRKYQRELLLNKRQMNCKICNVEIPPITKTYRRKICKPCRDSFVERYNKIKIQMNGIQMSAKKKGVMNCLLCNKSVQHRLFCSTDCSKLGRSIRKTGH